MRQSFLIILLGLLCSAEVVAQSSFYDTDSLREIRIYFYAEDWDHQLDSLYVDGQEERILADVKIDGTLYESVGVRYKGFSSVSVDRLKNPFNIKLDYVYEDQNHEGIDKLKLSNVIADPSFLREVLTYDIASDYMPCSRANYANVFINDTLWGLYTNVEAVNKSFLNDNFESKYGAFFKANPESLNIGPGGENSNLSDTHGTDPDNYEPYYELKSDNGWAELYQLIDTLNNDIESIESILNVDRTLWMHALNYVLINFDSYVGYGQNYYLYRDVTGQFNPIVWDLNMSLGSFQLTDASSLYYDGFNILEAQNMDPLVHHNEISIAPRPLMRNLFESERNRRMYLAHIRTIVQEHFANMSYYNESLELHSLIDTCVVNDTNKFYTYDEFLTNLDDVVSLVTVDCPGISQLMDARVEYLSAYPGFSGEPVISNITPGDLIPGEDLWITAEIEDAEEAMIGYRFGANMRFFEAAMFDDGEHNDGAAGDGVFGGAIPSVANSVDYYLYADNSEAGVFSPVRAAYEFYSLSADIPNDAVVINELMSNNVSVEADGSGNYEDWIELHNLSDAAVTTSGLYLSDNPENLLKWEMPNYSIEAEGYMVVWADEDGDQGALHANFKLSNLGETIYLSNADSIILDSVSFITQGIDIAYARVPNGTGPFILQQPTFNRYNEEIISVSSLEPNLLAYPNPFTTHLNFESPSDIIVRDVLGKVVFSSSSVRRIDTSTWSEGLYFIQSNNSVTKAIKI